MARMKDAATLKALLVAGALLSTGLLDESSVVSLLRWGRPRPQDRKQLPPELPVSDPWELDEGLVIPCPVRAKLRNGTVDLEVLCATRTSTRLLARFKNVSARGSRYPEKLGVDSLHVTDSDRVTYRLRATTDRARDSWLSFDLDPAPSPSSSWIEITDVSGQVTRVALAPALTSTTAGPVTSLGMHDAAEQFFLRQVGTLVFLGSAWTADAFKPGGVLDKVVQNLLEVIRALGTVGALRDPAETTSAFEKLVGVLRGEQRSEVLPASWRSMLDSTRATDGRAGGVVVDQEMAPSGERSVWIDSVVSWPERFELWAFCEPDASAAGDDFVSLPATAWSATDDLGSTYAGSPTKVWRGATGEEIVVRFAPRLNPRATSLEVSCFQGVRRSIMKIPLEPWCAPVSGTRSRRRAT